MYPGDLKPVKSNATVNRFSRITTLYVPFEHNSTHKRNDTHFPFRFLTLYRKYLKEMEGFKTDINRGRLYYEVCFHSAHWTLSTY